LKLSGEAAGKARISHLRDSMQRRQPRQRTAE
jgi:hypothetical protein